MKQETNLTPKAPSRYHDYEVTCWENGHEKGVLVGIEYQKEQDKATIDSLLETLRIIVKLDSLDNRVTVIANQAIQNYIK